MSRIPDFYVIGAMKSGSTSLWHHLRMHPDIFMCNPKEPQFFSHRSGWSKGEAWYRSLFNAASPRQLCGEASTCYSRYPHYGDVAGRIAHFSPSARLIYLLRDPVIRTYSHYLHESQERALEGRPVLTFRESWQSNPEMVDASRYIMQIRKYEEHFDRSQLFLRTTEELALNPARLSLEVVEFLGLHGGKFGPSDRRIVDNESLGRAYAQTASRKAAGRFVAGSIGSRLKKITPKSLRARFRRGLESSIFGWYSAASLRRLKSQVSPLGVEDRAELLEVLRDSIVELEHWWGRNLSDWLQPRSDQRSG